MSLLTSSVRSILRCSIKPNAGTSYAVRTLSTTSSAPTWTCRARTPSASLSLATNASRVYSKRTSSSPLVHRRRMGNPAAPQGALRCVCCLPPQDLGKGIDGCLPFLSFRIALLCSLPRPVCSEWTGHGRGNKAISPWTRIIRFRTIRWSSCMRN